MVESSQPAATPRWRSVLVEPPRPESVRARPNAAWLAVGTVCIGAFMGQLDASIVTLAFPTLARDFHTTLGAVQWVGLSYLLVLVGLVTAVGRMADMMGRKLLYVYGFAVFVVGSALCGLAPTLPLLDAARVLQALGAAMLQANSVAIIVAAVPRRQLGRAIGLQGAAQALGLSLGPVVGGALIAVAGWRLIFFVNVPAGIVGIVTGWFLIPRSRHLAERAPFDWLGLALFFPAVAAVLLAVSFGNERGWLSPATLAELATGLVLTGVFLRRQHQSAHPLLDLGLFRQPAFAAGIASGLLSYLVMFGALFVVPFFLENARRVGAGLAGVELTVMPFALGLTAPVAGRLADRLGARPLTVGGMALTAGALGAMAVAHDHTWLVVVELAVLGIGLGAFTPPNNASIMGAAPRARSGMAAGVLNMTRGFGTAVGLAATAAVFGAAAGTGQASPARTTTGFALACLFLAGVSVASMAIAALRHTTPLRRDPAAESG